MLIFLSFNNPGIGPSAEAYAISYAAITAILIGIAFVKVARLGALIGCLGAVFVNYYLATQSSGDGGAIMFFGGTPIAAAVGAIVGATVVALVQKVRSIRQRKPHLRK